MLNPTEKERLKNRDALTSKAKANLDYRVAQKIKKYLSALGEVREALDSLPEKNAMRVLNTDMVADVFELTEDMLRILRFSPVGLDFNGNGHVIRFGPGKQSKHGTIEFTASMETATEDDVYRHFLVEDHIKVLQHHVDLNQVPLPSSSDMPLRPLSVVGTGGLSVSRGVDRYRERRRPGLGPDAEAFGFK